VSPSGWLREQAPGRTATARVLGHRPELRDALAAFEALFWRRPWLDPVLLELCRLRVAQLTGCAAELAVRSRPAVEAGLCEEKIARLEDWERSPGFTASERACLLFTEKWVLDVGSITDADAAAVSQRLGSEGTVALCEALAILDGFARFRVLFGVEPEPGARPHVVEPPGFGEAP
jgi:AhpD family alkylhydroperoxidase